MAGFGGFGSTSNATNSNPFGAPSSAAAPLGPFGGGGGFGGGAAPVAANPFGAVAAPTPTAGYAPSFGSPTAPPAPFGAASNQPAATFGAASLPFGNMQQQQQQPNSNPFGGGGGGGFGNASTNTPPAAAAAAANPFGQTSSTTTGFGAPTAFAAPSSSWQPPTTTPFGNAATAPSSNPFGATTAMPMASLNNNNNNNNNNANPFGGPTMVAAPSSSSSSSAGGPPSMTPFGNGNSNPFGNVHTTANTSTRPTNPFGNNTAASTAPPPPPVFGNANTMDSNNNNMSAAASAGPFGQVASNTTTNGPFGQQQATVVQNPPFAQATTTAPFGQTSSLAPTSNPFGQTATSTTTAQFNPFASPNSGATTTTNKKTKPRRSDLPFGKPPQQQQSQHGNDDDGAVAGSTWPPPPPTTLHKSQGLGGQGDQQEHKKKLALLEKKKKRLEELKRRKEAEAKSSSSPKATTTTAAAGLNVGAAPFVPQAPPPLESSSLAERNATRFDPEATNSTTRAHLPTDLQAKAGQQVDYAALRSSGTGDRENLDQAKSLVGTCPYMCPDEELLRREREGDIQLLELVQPGRLHPQGWTLRNTAIKRFRRSAADYKLDVPEWVRPPDVLETVCGYLEEWIMERDRQGPDPRFKGGTPKPLDVYQFIWDRTRMIRKDFTLQNYVGTGGNCDARAVRCHERIARWHTLCEHQLSHISDFIVMQSQQNIQELGQTMKTLNQFYDDALKRSRVEVPDENGDETRTDLSGFSHGCANGNVQGNSPSDYDGAELNNSLGSPLRLLGNEGIHQYHHGTAEPEMRGLYILLTIDNDGGMEVMRYAAHLSRERPEIFQSIPVQLALNIYKAKKESNYSRFFRYLRSSSTPYLFACIMFKYVPQMRRLAFEIMSKTFGGKNRETNETLYDHYPLKDLVRNLCFEDEEEALAACKHYNITVKEVKVKSSSGAVSNARMIFWRFTDFSEPKDPEKNFPIPLRPMKLVSTIERKRKGATRLAVCRGDVSGEGAFLRGTETQSTMKNMAFEELAKKQAQALAAMKSEGERRERSGEIEKERQAREAERQKNLEAAKNQANLRKQQEQEQERARLEKLEQEKRLAKEREIARKQAEEAERQKRLEAESLERERKKAEQERLQKLEEERIRREKEEAERERQRLLEEQRKAEERRKAEEERKRKQAEAEHRRKEEEARQRELARIRDAQRRAREEEERRVTKEWNDKIDQARRVVALKVWKRKLPRRVEIAEETSDSLRHLRDASVPTTFLQMPFEAETRKNVQVSAPQELRSVVDCLLRSSERFQIDFDCLRSIGAVQEPCSSDRLVLLVKIGVVFPESSDERYAKLCSLVHGFADRRLAFGSSACVPFPNGETRITFVDGNIPENRYACEGVLVVVPSGNAGIPSDALESVSTTMSDIPRAAALLTQSTDSEKESLRIHRALVAGSEEVPIVRNTVLSDGAVDNALLAAVESLLCEVAQRQLHVVERIPVDRLGMLCLNEVLWLENILDSRDGLLEAAKDSLAVLTDKLHSFGKTGKDDWDWPSEEFVSNDKLVPDYFGKGVHLPANWPSSLLRENVELPLQELACRLNGTFPHVISKLLAEAPIEVVEECHEMFEQRMFRRCLQRALIWRQENEEPWQTVRFVYLPRTLVQRVIRRTVEAVGPSQTGLGEANQYEEREVQAEETPFPIAAPIQPLVQDVDDDAPPEPVMDIPVTRKRVTAISDENLRRNRPSKRLRDSQDFTRRLEAMASGKQVSSVWVGNQPLSTLLRGAPPPLDPVAWNRKRNSRVEDII